jgi:hypothetical protein
VGIVVRDFNACVRITCCTWSMLEGAAARGCTTFDFGRSTPNEGTYKFKEQWGASPVPLYWEYGLLGGGELPNASPTNRNSASRSRCGNSCPSAWLTGSAR